MISKLVAYETGKLDNTQIVALFQNLLDTGVIYVLQGHYQRTAQGFLEQGLITKSPAKKVRRRLAKRLTKAESRARAKATLIAEDEVHAGCMEDAFGPHGQG